MRRLVAPHGILGGLLVLVVACRAAPPIELTTSDETVEVSIAGSHVATYRFAGDLTKPVLHPLRTRAGLRLNRCFPLATQPGESTDHPHHVGLFFTYGDVNGVDYWGNTRSPPRIASVTRGILEGDCGGRGLRVVHEWIDEQGHRVLVERRDMVFRVVGRDYVIDFRIELTAGEQRVVFGDTKEGMFAIRVAPWLREDSGSGHYLAASGARTAGAIWGTRERWVCLSGEDGERQAGLAILNLPGSVNWPTFWHARAYGLFAANPLGQLVFEKTRGVAEPQQRRLTLEPHQTATFLFSVLVFDGPADPEVIERLYRERAAVAGDRGGGEGLETATGGTIDRAGQG